MITNEPAPISERTGIWESAIESARKHVKLGASLQGQGLKMLQDPDAEPDKATAIVERGVRIERDANNWLIELFNNKPRGK